MAKPEVTNDEIMTALTQFAGSVDERFDKVDERFEAVDRRFDKIEAKLHEHDARFDEHDRRFDKIDEDTNRIYGILDTHMARIEKLVEENSVQTHQQDRLQRWIFQLADQAGVQLKYE